MQLDDRKALVTGASQGIGRAIALALAQAGADVAITARSTEKLEQAAREIRARGRHAHVITADMAVESDARRVADTALERLGRVDILVNNAAIIHKPVDVVDFDPALWRQVLDVNLTGIFLLCRALLPAMFESRAAAGCRAKIINIASIGGRRGARRRSAYRVTKAGLISFTESLAAEVHPHGVDVNAICPGGVRTEGFAEAFGEEAAARPNLMSPEEIADLAVFLASDASSAVTGTAVDAFGSTNPIFA